MQVIYFISVNLLLHYIQVVFSPCIQLNYIEQFMIPTVVCLVANKVKSYKKHLNECCLTKMT